MPLIPEKESDPQTTPPWKQTDFEARGPGVLLRARNLRKLDYAIIILLGLFGYMFYQHMEDTKKAILEQIKSNAEVAASIRLFSCLYAVSSDKREVEMKDPYSLCSKMGKP